MKRYLLLGFIYLMTFTVNGQKNTVFIQQELKNLEVKLTKKGENLILTNAQREQLISLLDDKGKRVARIKSSMNNKDEISGELLKLEKEFEPRIYSILNKEQRVALQDSRLKKQK